MTDFSRCQFCGAAIEPECDVCERHAMSYEQLAEMAGRVQDAMREYCLEIWPDLRRDEA
jgi:biotin synthase-like enzyme